MGGQPRSPGAFARHLLAAPALGTLLSVTLVLGVDAAWHDDGSGGSGVLASRADPVAENVRRAMQRHRCSTEGFGTDRQPSTALVRTGRGRLQLVSFDRGWEIYTGERPGTLVAVCLDPPRGHADS